MVAVRSSSVDGRLAAALLTVPTHPPCPPTSPCPLQELRAERARLVETLETLAAQVRVAVGSVLQLQ